jgi:hypothetical protein
MAVSRVGVLLAAVALLMAGCGTDGEGAEKDATAGSSARALAGQLVDADDLGAGWTVLDPPEDYGDVGVVTDKNRGMVPRIQFCGQATSASQKAAKDLDWEAFTQVNYDTDDERHLLFVQEFVRSDTAANVQATYDLLAAGTRACHGQESEYPDGEVGAQTALDVPALGEDRIGTRELVTEPGGGGAATWDIRSALVRDGTVLLGITVVEIVTPGTEKVLDDAEVSSLMSTVAGKVG